MTVTVVTDSAATLPEAMATQLGVVVVPLLINVDGESYRDGELDVETLLARAEDIKTSGPTPRDFLDAIESTAGGDGVLLATVSQDMGGSTFLSARAAADLAGVPSRVVDTATAAGGEGLVVLAAAQAAAAGADLDAVERVARRTASRVRLVATLPDLDHLVRSGHVREAAAWAARFIGVRPVIGLRKGRVSPLSPALSEPAARRKVLEAWRSSRPRQAAALHVAALHSVATQAAEELLTEVTSEVEPETSFVGSFGTAMLVHSGPGVVGLAWWWDGPDQP